MEDFIFFWGGEGVYSPPDSRLDPIKRRLRMIGSLSLSLCLSLFLFSHLPPPGSCFLSFLFFLFFCNIFFFGRFLGGQSQHTHTHKKEPVMRGDVIGDAVDFTAATTGSSLRRNHWPEMCVFCWFVCFVKYSLSRMTNQRQKGSVFQSSQWVVTPSPSPATKKISTQRYVSVSPMILVP